MSVGFAARAVLIDLDGTLVDSLPDIACAVNAMLADLGHSSLPVERIAIYVGKGVDVLVHRALTGTMDDAAAVPLFERARQSFYQHYGAVNGNESRMFADVREALDNLRSKHLKLACVTNKPREFTLQLLDKTGLHGAFNFIVCGDDTQQKKPHPEPMLHASKLLGVAPVDAIAIGDSENDVLSAQAAGCRVIVVETGYNEGRSLSELNADAIVPSLLDAARLIKLQTD